MPTVVKLSLAVLLVGSTLLAYLGPPPQRLVGIRVRACMLAAGLMAYALAAVALAANAVMAGVLAIALASEIVCAAGWLGRGDLPPADDDDDDGGGGGGGRGPKPSPSDWDAFERAFRSYARERDRQPA